MPRFVVIGRTAVASPSFLLDDLAGSSGRLDVLVRCVRAALLVSHGLRRDAVLDLVLCGGEAAPRTLRISGAEAKFLRPEERSVATLLKKALTAHDAAPGEGFIEVRPGVRARRGGLGDLVRELGGDRRFMVDQGGVDVRVAPDVDDDDAVFFFGDHLGFDGEARGLLASAGASPLGLGPVSVHAEDAIAILWNEIDRRRVSRGS